MQPVVKTCLSGLVLIYIIAIAHLLIVLQSPPLPRSQWSIQPIVTHDANLVRPELYAMW